MRKGKIHSTTELKGALFDLVSACNLDRELDREMDSPPNCRCAMAMQDVTVISNGVYINETVWFNVNKASGTP